MKSFVLFGLVMLLSACTGVPEGIKPVQNFSLPKYLGTWYEIARLDHSFERGLSRVTAQYSMQEDGGVKVINRGYNAEEEQWDEAQGKAYFVSEPTVGHLKVSFFGPFYASYVIAELDKNAYQYALVTGPDRDYLWILSRTPTMDDTALQALVDKATALGFDTSALIYVEQQ